MTKQYIIVSSIFLVLLITSGCGLTNKNAPDKLYSFDTEKLGSKNMSIVVEELSHSDNISVVRETVNKRGSYAGAIVFSLCSFSVIAENRGYKYFTVLNTTDNPWESHNEWSVDRKIGLLIDIDKELTVKISDKKHESVQEKNNRELKTKKYLEEQFPYQTIDADTNDIVSVKEYWPLCKNVRNICSW
ncbi:hypothetical protein [Desulforhopalus sp. 52FAK]